MTSGPSTTLLHLLGRTPVRLMVGDPRVRVSGLAYDSRKVRAGDAFVALVGEASDGHDFIPKALAAGAKALVVSRRPAGAFEGVPVALVDDSRAALATLSTAWFRRPSRRLEVLGVTGTNGKTTVTYLLQSLVAASGGRAAVLGTTGYRWQGAVTPLANTTPESLELQRMLRRAVDDGATHVALEVSSHGLETHRLEGTEFAVRIFTNLSRDHLDFHGDMESYFQAKRRLFVELSTGVPVVNADDPHGARLLAELPDALSFSVRAGSLAAVRPKGDPEVGAGGVRGEFETPAGRVPVDSPLLGEPNLENIAAMIATGVALGMSADTLSAAACARIHTPGRLQRVPDPVGGRLVVVDYAHTPDALARALQAVSEVTPGRVWAVFGCGGERDRGKRPLMARAACVADRLVLTDDNPRGEDPDAIRAEALAGLAPAERARLREIGDRREAIAWALSQTSAGDAVVVAGKGHEAWQEIEGVRLPFDDAQVCAELLGAGER